MSEAALIVEDDEAIRELIRVNLSEVGLEYDYAADGKEGLSKASSGDYAVIILDLMLPELGGIEVCRQVRTFDKDTPILILTARNTEIDRVLGLELGADDYLAKPFVVAELIARIKALLRRSRRTKELLEQRGGEGSAAETAVLDFGDLVIDLAKRKVARSGEVVVLSPIEFDLLVFLASNPGVVYNRGRLLSEVWGYESEAYESNVNAHINRLRHKLEADPRDPKYVKTSRGVGYFFAGPDDLED